MKFETKYLRIGGKKSKELKDTNPTELSIAHVLGGDKLTLSGQVLP